MAFVRHRRDEQLDTERTIAEAAQRAVAPPVPGRVGPVRCAGLYRAAQRGTLVGGDFFDVRESAHGVRAVLGDVQGHGLAAVATVSSLLGAFREAVLDQPDLESLAGRLDRRLVVDSARDATAELFATAVLVEFTPDADAVRVVACGHPPPVLLRDGAAVEVDVVPWTPLGLGLAGASLTACGCRCAPATVSFIASDGVSEARDADGVVLPPAGPAARARRRRRPGGDRRPGLGGRPRYSPAIRDDVTMLVLAPESAADRPRTAEGLGVALGVDVRQDPVQPPRRPPGVRAQQRHHGRHQSSRTTVASISTLTARPRPSILTTMLSLMMNAENTLTMIRAAQVMTRAVISRAWATESLASPVRSHASCDAGEQEDLVVHAEAEDDREHHHRHVALDGHVAVDAQRGPAPAPLEDRDDDAVGGGDRQDVEDGRLDARRAGRGRRRG